MAERVNKKTKARWLKQLHQWHWISSALCLISMVLFSVTGITPVSYTHLTLPTKA